MALPAPRLAITLGDPRGIGPELVQQALAAAIVPRERLLVVGPAGAGVDVDLAVGGWDGEGGAAAAGLLAGAAVALLVVLVRRGRLPKVWAVLEPAGRVRPVVPAVLRVGAGPPAVWRFSVIRC